MSVVSRYAKPKVGDRFNSWVVLEPPQLMSGTILCQCDCGAEKEVGSYNLLNGKSKQCISCSVSAKFKAHGDSGDRFNGRKERRVYKIWKAMKWRCNPNNKTARSYNERGIVVCPEWGNSYEAFRDWALANGYRDDLTVDRIDNDRGYSPENCRWANYHQQARNRSSTRMVTAFGETKSAIEWSEDERCLISKKALWLRLRRGWPPELAITAPLGFRPSDRA